MKITIINKEKVNFSMHDVFNKDGAEILAAIRGCESRSIRRVVILYDSFQEEWIFDGSSISNAWDIIGWQPLPPAPSQHPDKER